MLKLVLYLLGVLVYSCTYTSGTRTVNNYLSPNDLNRLQKVFVDGLSSNDLQGVYYASLNIETTSATGENALCKQLRSLHEESKLNKFEKDLYLIGANKNLRCTEKLPQELLSSVYAAVKSDISSSQEIYYIVATHKILGVEVDPATKAKISEKLKDILKKDDSLSSLGYAFSIAPELGNTANFIAERVEDAIVQADEVDGKNLQFEGGLSITALVVNGAFRVTKAFNKPSPLTADQAVKLANYFLSRRSVQSPKGAHVLIEALKTLSTAENIAPISIQIIGNGQLAPEAPTLNIAVTDLLGKAVTPSLQNIQAKIISKKDNKPLAEKIAFASKSSDKTTYAIDLSKYKPTRGVYTAELIADTVFKQTVQFKILGRVKVQTLELGIAETDASAATKKQNINYPNTLKQTLSADNTQKVLLKSLFTDEITTQPITVHQAFVRLYSKEFDHEIIFVAEHDSSKTYKFDMDVGARAAEFNHNSGLYKMFLIVGDSSLSNSFEWHVANIELKFAQDSKVVKKQPIRAALPVIEHMFRAPEKRPPRIVSDVFTGLCLTPLVLLLIFWNKLGINVSNFDYLPCTFGFHMGFGGILALFVVFWLQLNMFVTLRLLIPIAVFTFLCGNRLLRRIYAHRVGKAT